MALAHVLMGADAFRDRLEFVDGYGGGEGGGHRRKCNGQYRVMTRASAPSTRK